MSYEETLEYMLSLKQILADRYEITNSDRMARLLGERKFNEKEVELVYELFDYNYLVRRHIICVERRRYGNV